MKQNIFTILFVGFLVMSAVALSACNTVEGFGRDLQDAGESIQGGAD